MVRQKRLSQMVCTARPWRSFQRWGVSNTWAFSDGCLPMLKEISTFTSGKTCFPIHSKAFQGFKTLSKHVSQL